MGGCVYCDRTSAINGEGACRLCWENARRVQEIGRAVDLDQANRHGQQLYLANNQYDVTGAKRRRIAKERQQRRLRTPAPALTIVGWRQLLLFRMPPHQGAVKKRALTQDSPLLRYCTPALREHSARHSWTKRLINGVAHTIKLLEVLQETPGAKIRASDVLASARYGATVVSTLEILDAAGVLEDDRILAVERYFVRHAAGLPTGMTEQLQLWFDTMLQGSDQVPRRRPRHVQTIHMHILGMAPIWQAWAAQGHESFAEITTPDVRKALPARGATRLFAEQGLRSLFTVLKANKRIFANPTRGMSPTPTNTTVPLPLDTQKIRDGLNSPDAASALAVALVAFHALTGPQIQALTLTDITGGKLTLAQRTIPLAGPVKSRLSAYLDHRARTWPNTLNPHLFISRKTAPRIRPVGTQFPWTTLDVTPQALRDDRILQEIYSTGGDVRRLCDFFGLGIDAALRYHSALDDPGLTDNPTPKPGTHDLT